jgi:hypothetical protein
VIHYIFGMPPVGFSDDTIDLDLGSPSKHIAFIVVVLALVLPAIYRCYRIFRADRIAITQNSYEGYSRAIGYDPSNAVLWWRRGRTSHYSIQDSNIPQAVRDYTKALSLNPRIGQAWLDLADCYERLGQYREAEQALDQAFLVRTYSPAAHWQAANYFLRRGNLPKMYEHFRLAGQYNPERFLAALNLSWKVETDHARMVQELMPSSMKAQIQLLDFLAHKNQTDLARPVWKRIMEPGNPRGNEFTVSDSFSYLDSLLAMALVPEALQVWGESLQKTKTGLSDSRYAAAFQVTDKPVNLVWNGSFEYGILRGGFDWRYPESPDLDLQIGRNNCPEGVKCVELNFAKGGTPPSECLSQVVPIPAPGLYTLELFVRIDRPASARSFYIMVTGYPDSSGTALRLPIPSSAGSWQKMTVPVIVKPNTGAVLLSVHTEALSEAGSRSSGTLRLDGVAIYRSSQESR